MACLSWNAAARLVLHFRKYSHITPAPYELHWLPVQHRVYFYILILTFKAIHGLVPKHIVELILIKTLCLDLYIILDQIKVYC